MLICDLIMQDLLLELAHVLKPKKLDHLRIQLLVPFTQALFFLFS
jgi:hypothetical protein